MKKILMGTVFAMILTAGITTSLAADSFRGSCNYTDAACGWRFVDEDNDGVCDNYGQGGCGRGTGFTDEDGDGVCDFGGGTRPMDGTGYRSCGRNR